MVGLGTIINIITVIVGGSIGLLVGKGLSDNLRDIVMKGLGLVTLIIGFRMALDTKNIFIPMASMVFGGLLGEWWGIKAGLDHLGESMKRASTRLFSATGGDDTFSEGFVTASLVFAVGPMTVLGAIQDGLTGNFKLLAIKAGLDGFAAMVFAATLGIGVLFSIFTLIVYQGGLTAVAALARGSLGAEEVANSLAVGELSATGGILIIGIGLALLEIKDVRVSNFLPAIVLAPVIVILLSAFGVGL
ncbi:MAG: DUF554 domain-containing protein [Candidatus Acetothermia bacterium]|nr:DUF554 domain-containing protein [Candidatus Bipolaricaulota bacterium]